MKRKIIQIDETLCDGCGICVNACHESALILSKGKAKLIREDYCDGLGNCLPTCPQGAITFIEKDTLPFDAAAVHAAIKAKEKQPSDCSSLNSFEKTEHGLLQWPVQLQLLPISANFYHQAEVLICADCCAYANAELYQQQAKERIVMIGCPKLDTIEYTQKLTAIFQQNAIHKITLMRMEVPCCKGIERSVVTALERSGKQIPMNLMVVSTKGELL